MDNQTEPVTQLADEPDEAAPQLDTTARKPDKSKPGADAKPADPDAGDAKAKPEAERKAAAKAASSASSKPSPSGSIQPPPAGRISSTSDTMPVTRPVSPAKPADAAKAEPPKPEPPKPEPPKVGSPSVGSPKADAPAAASAKAPVVPEANVKPEIVADPGAAVPVQVVKSANGAKPGAGSGSPESTSSSPATSRWSTPAPGASPSGVGRPSGSSGSAAPAGGSPGLGGSASPGTPPSAGPWSASAPGSPWSPSSARPASAGGAPTAGGPSGGGSFGSGPFASGGSAPSPSGNTPWGQSAARSSAAEAPASSRPSYPPGASSASAPPRDSVTDLAAGLLASTQIPDRVPPAKSRPAGSPSVRSSDLKSKVTASFAAAAKSGRKLKPGAPARAGGAIGNGRAMSLKSKGAPVRRPAAQVAPEGGRPGDVGVRDAQLVIARIEPWSVMKFSFLLSLVGWAVLFIVVAICYFLFSVLGVFTSIEHTITLVTSSQGNPGSNAASWFSAATVLGFTLIAGGIDVVIITALSTVVAVIYNWVTRISGGIEVTLAEAD